MKLDGSNGHLFSLGWNGFLWPFGVAGMVVIAMILQLAFGVEVFLTLVTGILKHSRKVLAFHMPFDVIN